GVELLAPVAALAAELHEHRLAGLLRLLVRLGVGGAPADVVGEEGGRGEQDGQRHGEEKAHVAASVSLARRDPGPDDGSAAGRAQTRSRGGQRGRWGDALSIGRVDTLLRELSK